MSGHSKMRRCVLACVAASAVVSGGMASAGTVNSGNWFYRTETDLTKAIVYVAEFENQTSSLAIKCGGAAGDYVAVNIGLAGMQLTTTNENRRVGVDFNFRKTKGTTPQGDRLLTQEIETARAIGDIEMKRPADIALADALVLFDEVDVTIHDPRSKMFDTRAKFPLSGAVGPIRTVFQKCPALKGLPTPGTQPAWHAFDEVFDLLRKADAESRR